MLHTPVIVLVAVPVEVTPSYQVRLWITIGGQSHPGHHITLANGTLALNHDP